MSTLRRRSNRETTRGGTATPTAFATTRTRTPRRPATRAGAFALAVGALSALAAATPVHAATYPDPPPDFAHPGDPHATLFSPAGGLPDRPMLVIYAEFTDLTYAQTTPSGLDAAYMADRFFGGFPSVADYFADDSSGALRLTPAPETDSTNGGAADDGVVSVSVDMDKGDFLSLGRSAEQKVLLELADAAVDYASFDRDDDGRVTQDELVVHRMDVDPDPAGAIGCATARRPDAVELDGVHLGGGSNLLIVNAGTDTNVLTLVHETGHAAYSLPDLYFWNVGRFSLGGPTCAISDSTFFRTSAWEKIHLGWLAPTVVTADGFHDVDAAGPGGDAFVLYDPDKGTDDYFVVENRARTAGTYDGGTDDDGLVVWRLEDDEYTAFGEDSDVLGPTGGFITVIRPTGDRAWDPSDSSTPERTMSAPWRDGSASRVAVRAIPAAGPTMRPYFDVRGPGVLVDPSTPAGQPMTVTVTPQEQNVLSIPVMNTGEEPDDFLFTVAGLPAGWAGTADARALVDHVAALASPVVVPAADAPTDTRTLGVVGRSATDAGIRTESPLRVTVVLDRTAIAYTGPTVLPTGESAALSATVTNPDDAGTPPVAGVDVTFRLDGSGGTQTATATTAADGTATATPVVSLPPGDYELVVSTPRDGKHAPAEVTVPVRIPTVAERIDGVRDDVVAAGLAHGIERSLVAKLDRARAAAESDRDRPACGTLGAVIAELRAQSGRHVPATLADSLIEEVESIQRQIGC